MIRPRLNPQWIRIYSLPGPVVLFTTPSVLFKSPPVLYKLIQNAFVFPLLVVIFLEWPYMRIIFYAGRWCYFCLLSLWRVSSIYLLHRRTRSLTWTRMEQLHPTAEILRIAWGKFRILILLLMPYLLMASMPCFVSKPQLCFRLPGQRKSLDRGCLDSILLEVRSN